MEEVQEGLEFLHEEIGLRQITIFRQKVIDLQQKLA